MKSSRAILDEIAGDNLSGASSILSMAVDYFRAVLRENSGASLRGLDDAVHKSGRELLKAQSAMAPLYNLVAELLFALRPCDEGSQASETLALVLSNVPEAARKSLEKAISRAVEYVPAGSTILTVSYSSAVRDLVVSHPARDSLTVVIPESRPMCEGVLLAKALGRQSLRTVLIADFAVSRYMDTADLFICGADAVTEDYVVNKIGTACISEMMRKAGKNTLALFTGFKIITGKILKFDSRPHDQSEITKEIVPFCTIENHYFEMCPTENFTHLVSEDSCYSPRSLHEKVSRMNYPAGMI